MRERQLKYRWERTWPDKPQDYVVYDGSVKFGRVYFYKARYESLWLWFVNLDDEPFGPFAEGQHADKMEACKAMEAAYDAAKEKARQR